MAERRMFAKTIIDSDSFLDMPLSAQALYFHLSMRADDDGFINNPKKIQRTIGCADDDMRLLVAKSFIIPFESGVVVIKHWRINNYIQKDRYKPTTYTDERAQLQLKENGSYTECIQNGYNLDTQVRLGKVRDIKEKDSLTRVEKESQPDNPSSPSPKHKYGAYKNVLLTEKEYQSLIKLQDGEKAIEFLSEYREYKGYKAKSDFLAIKKWVFEAMSERRVSRNTARNFTEREYTKQEIGEIFGNVPNIEDYDI